MCESRSQLASSTDLYLSSRVRAKSANQPLKLVLRGASMCAPILAGTVPKSRTAVEGTRRIREQSSRIDDVADNSWAAVRSTMEILPGKSLTSASGVASRSAARARRSLPASAPAYWTGGSLISSQPEVSMWYGSRRPYQPLDLAPYLTGVRLGSSGPGPRSSVVAHLLRRHLTV